jgi:hypothetical protein
MARYKPDDKFPDAETEDVPARNVRFVDVEKSIGLVGAPVNEVLESETVELPNDMVLALELLDDMAPCDRL